MRIALIKQEKYVKFFQDLAKSKEVIRLENKSLIFAATIEEYKGEEIPKIIDNIKALEKEVEKERSIYNDFINDMKRLNQDIYQPIKDNLKKLRETAKNNYDEWIREETRKRRALQAKLEAEAKLKRVEQQRKIDEAKKNNSLPPPEIIIPTPQVREPEIVKSIARKEIKAVITNKKLFLEFALVNNDNELLDCIEVTKMTGIINQAKRNPGVEIEGVDILYYPTREAWGIVDKEPEA